MMSNGGRPTVVPLAIGRSRETNRSTTPTSAAAPPSPKDPISLAPAQTSPKRVSQPINVSERPVREPSAEERTAPNPPLSSTPGKQMIMKNDGGRSSSSRELLNKSPTASPLPASPAFGSPPVGQSPPVRRVTSAKALDMGGVSGSPAASPPTGAPVKRDRSPRPSVFAVFAEGSAASSATPPVSSTPSSSSSSSFSSAPLSSTAIPLLSPIITTTSTTISAGISQSDRSASRHYRSSEAGVSSGTTPRLRRSPSTDDILTVRPAGAGLRRSPSTESFFQGVGTLRLRSQAISVIEKEKEDSEMSAGGSGAAKKAGTETPPREVDIRRSIAKTRAERTLRRMTKPQLNEFMAAMPKAPTAPVESPPALVRSTSAAPSSAPTPPSSSATASSARRPAVAAETVIKRPPAAPKLRTRTIFLNAPQVIARFSELLDLENSGEELTKALRRFADRTDLAARNEQGLTPLHEACEAHAVHAVLELIRLKAPVTLRAAGGNTPLHLLFRSTKWQEFKDHKSLTHIYGSIISAAAKQVPQKQDILEAENDRGEALLFRAASAGNFTAVMVLLHHGSNPFAAFYPEDPVPTHDDSVRALQVALTDAKSKIAATLMAETKKSKKNNKSAAMLRPAHIHANEHVDLKSGPPSSWQYMAARMHDDPLASDTMELITKLFSAAYAHRTSWSMMQNVQLTEDHTSLLKEERGRYYVGFAACHEVLQCLKDSFTLWNSSDLPIRYEISKYFPDLSTWDAAMLRLEVIGQRRGVLQPGERQRLQVNLFSTGAIEFRQLICVTYTDATQVNAKPRGLYFFLAASLRPPSDLQTLEIGRSLLPVLSDVMGVGGSATVFRVANFLLAFTQAKHLAVKRFNYSIEGGLQETSEDYRRFRLELYISSKMMHPNVVRTYGFVAHPPCLVMEFVPMNLRRLIDDRSKPLALHFQMKIAIHIAKGMAYLHSFNIIHRDLKPGNVLVSDSYDAKVADFGVSLAAKKGPPSKSKSAAKETSEVVRLEGTDFYMAPELFVYTSGSQQTFSLDTDVYAFGIVLYELFNRCNLLEDLLKRGFNRTDYYKRRARGDYPVEGLVPAPHPAIRDLLLACWSPVPSNRVAFQAIVDILTELRAELLELSLEEEFDEAHKEGLEIRVLKEWNSRRASPNADDAERFTTELRGNRQVAAALVRYFLTANPSPAAEAELASLFALYLGHKDAAEFLLNLSSLRPALAELKPARVEAFLTQVLGTALASPPAMRDHLYRAGLAEDDVLAWFEFVDQAARDPSLRQRLGPARYDAELTNLDRRMEELREELKRCEKRKAKLEAAPPATEFLSAVAGLDSLPPELPDALLENLEREVEQVAQTRTGARLAADVNRLEARLGAIERLCARGTQAHPRIEALRSKLQELLILTTM